MSEDADSAPATHRPGVISPEHLDGDEFDVVVIGTGSAGKPLAGELAKAGRSVLTIEQDLIGGECPYLACIPSKALLLAAGRYRLEHAAATGQTGPDRAAFARAVDVRDRTTRHRDDSVEATELQKDGVSVVRARAVVDGRSVRLEAGSRSAQVRWRQALVLATGAEAIVPPIDGLAEAQAVWTSPQALSSAELPDRLGILGGGAIGCELAQVYASFGTQVTLIEAAPTLLPRESGWLGDAMAEALRAVGVDVRTGTKLTAVKTGDSNSNSAALALSDGTSPIVDRLLVAVGKRPRTSDLGLESLGICSTDAGALPVDGRLRVITETGTLDDVFAIGDVTGIAPYTHAANYHARLVAAHLLGHGRDADHFGIPRVVYTDPAVLAAGETEAGAKAKGIAILTASFDATQTSRAAIERTLDRDDHRPAAVELIADAATGVLIGAAAIGPEADSWAAELALAVRARLNVDVIAQHAHAFPSWTEAIHVPARELADKIAGLTRFGLDA
jgi:pyruvate/2-oxoglutarate dehydrogenase complex dihydrolipoamide dehydrogenase (E3) component